MIIIQVTNHSIKMTGHAGKKESDGVDRVCAAVSALTCNLINSLQDLTRDAIHAEIGSGLTVIWWENLSDGGKLMVDSWFLGLTDINREYNCIQFQ